MPDRIVRQAILTSERVNKLSWPAEVFYRRLMSIADDYGRSEARPNILRAYLYPAKLDKVSDSDVVKWLSECSKAGLVRIYHVDSKEYVEILQFGQRLRAMKSKYPQPSAECGHSLADDSGSPPETNRRESESETESEEKRKPQAAGGASLKIENLFPEHFSIDFTEVWIRWKKYKKEEFRFSYKSEDSEKESIEELLKLSRSNEVVARAMIKKSMAKGWRGFFELDDTQEIIKNVQKTQQTVQKIDPIVTEVNYLFESYKEDPDRCTIISVDEMHYNVLKKAGLMKFDAAVAELIKKEATDKLTIDNLVVNETSVRKFSQKFAVIHLFKSLKETGAETVFYDEN